MRAMPRFSAATNAASPGAALGIWQNFGPNNQGGRTRALLIDPNNPNIKHVGVWKSTNTDLTFANLAVSTLAFQPGNSNVTYAGPGEGVGNANGLRASSFPWTRA
jgi:hypothetical protein